MPGSSIGLRYIPWLLCRSRMAERKKAVDGCGRETREAQSLVLFGTNSSSDVGQNGQGVRASTRLCGFGPTPGPVRLAKGARWACQEVRLVPAINVETCLLWGGPTTLSAASPQPGSFHHTHNSPVTEDESRQPPSPCQTATANPKIGLEA